MRTEKDFLDWLYGATFYHGTCRYGQFPGYHVFATAYDYDEELRDLLDDLEGGDYEAIRAAEILVEMQESNEIWLATDDNPGLAMMNLTKQLRTFYFNKLNDV